ncbi:hypothetical protein SEUCBS139899_007077 [Sporothrix eucalyptigena]|uniref:2EXR domain-containing protein n=1 Tax=Sporothrix eucalyptigena TaxID=1812306 RepID=A0ABP0CMH7_9PEZI
MASSILYSDPRDVVYAKVVRLASLMGCAALNPALSDFFIAQEEPCSFETRMTLVEKERLRISIPAGTKSEYLYKLYQQAEYLVGTLARINAFAVKVEHQLPPTTSPTPLEVPANAPTTFPQFTRLPMELQLQIWELIPRPIHCWHYGYSLTDVWMNIRSRHRFPCGEEYGNHIDELLSVTLPSMHLMPDWGLWRTCKASRDLMEAAYDKCEMERMLDGCRNPESLDEWFYQDLVKLNFDGTELQVAFHRLYAKFQVPDDMQFPKLRLINTLFEPTMSDEWLALINHEDTIQDFEWCYTV